LSVLFTTGVATGWLAGVFTLHRFNVRRTRAQAQGFATLRRLDWDLLLEGLLPAPREEGINLSPPEGGPGPRLLAGDPVPQNAARHAVLSALVSGTPISDDEWHARGFAGAEVPWLQTLARVRTQPFEALERLERSKPTTAAEVYLRETLLLSHAVHALNLEWFAFGAKLRLNQAMDRFEKSPALYYARAQASALLGFKDSVLDDLARAVYHSRQTPFYLRVVVDMPWIAEARPPLHMQCRRLLAPGGDLSSTPPPA
jgi:hypothetical protein